MSRKGLGRVKTALGMSARAARARVFQAAIVVISGLTPTMFMTRVGIDLAHLDRVFDAFYSTKSGGTGMGLSICRSIVQAHGGKLWAEANEPRGAVFQFTLPTSQENS